MSGRGIGYVGLHRYGGLFHRDLLLYRSGRCVDTLSRLCSGDGGGARHADFQLAVGRSGHLPIGGGEPEREPRAALGIQHHIGIPVGELIGGERPANALARL